MLTVIMPTGAAFGWGICGKMIALELLKKRPLRLITNGFSENSIDDPQVFAALKPYVVLDPLEKIARDYANTDTPVLQAITGNDLKTWGPVPATTFRCGYTFFENNILPQSAKVNAKNFDVIATGSNWCCDVLRGYGIENCRSVLQGVDTKIFCPDKNHRKKNSDRFVIFSGGKFEYRKGQDLVIAALKPLMDKYPDIYFVNAWYNHWPESMASIMQSPYIKANPQSGSFTEIIQSILAENSIDLKRVLTLPCLANRAMAEVYRNSDIGLFPNRCEGGTNLVLMEYMACGKAAVVSDVSGHKDIINSANSFPVHNSHPLELKQNGNPVARWQEPDLDEILSLLESAYLNREKVRHIGEQASLDLGQFTWEKTADNFLTIFKNHGF